MAERNLQKYQDRCDKVMFLSFCAAIYFLPISIALLEISTGAAFICYLLKRAAGFGEQLKRAEVKQASWGEKFRCFLRAFKPVSSVLNRPISIVLFVSLISVILSQHVVSSIQGFVGKILQSAFLYFNFIECMNTRKRLRIFLRIFLISCTLICINGLYQKFVGQGFIFGHIFEGRVSSSFRQANDFGSYLVMVIPILFCLFFSGGKEWKIRGLFAALFLVALICLGLTYSRGAWVGFGVSLILASIFMIKTPKVWISFLCLVVIFLTVFYPKLNQQRSPITDKQSFSYENNRLKYWDRAMAIIKDYPVFGCGVNAYAQVEGRYTIGWGGYPHNSYLQMAADRGVVGLGAFLWMLLILFYQSLKSLKRISVQENKMLLFSFLTGLLAFLIHSFFDTTLYSVQLGSLFWLMMGFIVAFQNVEADSLSSVNK